MMNRVLPSLALASVLTACSAPLVMPTPPTFQAKVSHVGDWRILAQRTAWRFSAAHDRSVPVFVAPGPADMPFASAFRSVLEEALHRNGFQVAETVAVMSVDGRSDAIMETYSHAAIVRFGVQAFLYKNDGGKPVPYGTALAALYAGGEQLRRVANLDTGAAIGAGVGPVWDILSSVYDTTKAEVALDISVYSENGTRLEYRDSDTFYVNPAELDFYTTRVADTVPQSKNQSVAEVPLPVR